MQHYFIHTTQLSHPPRRPFLEVSLEQSIQVWKQRLLASDSFILSHPVSNFACFLRIKTFSLRFISFVQMYLNPFFSLSIIFGCSRPGVFTEGVPPPCFRTVALINSWGCCFRGGGISHRPRCACLKRTQVSPLCFWARCPLSPPSGGSPRRLCTATDGLDCVLFIAFPPASLISPWQSRVEGTEAPVSWCSALHVPVSGPQCPSTVCRKVEQALKSPNGIINSLSKEITPSRVKGGELWREHVLMSFMTLQIMHYRQERSWEAPSHNCIDFSLMATNNDIFFLIRGKDKNGLYRPRAYGRAHTLTLTRAHSHTHELIHSLGMPF